MLISLKPQYIERYKDIGLLFWKYGRKDFFKSSGFDEILHEKERSLVDFSEAKPEELARDLEKMGPIYIKLGQLLSTRSDLLPEEYLKALSKLQDNLHPFSFEETEYLIKEELGVRITKAFSSFESKPIATASLGQVYRAVLHDGRNVVVKVQRPGIRTQIAKDLDALESIAEFLDHHANGLQMHYSDILDEFRHDLVRELDYRQEAKNLSVIGENLRKFRSIIIPSPVGDYTTSKILTMDYIAGTKVTALSPLAQLEMEGAPLAEELFEAYLKQILIDGVFHADPHPGNVFITEDHKIALIDLGMVGRIGEEMQEKLLKLVLAVSEGNTDAVGSNLMEIGTPLENFDEKEFRKKITVTINDEQGATIEDIQMGRSLLTYKRFAAESGLEMPSELTLVSKTLLNLDLVGRTLDPNFQPNEAIKRNATETIRKRFMKSLSPSNLFTSMIETKEFLRQMPHRINRILDSLAKNQFRISIDYGKEETFIEGFQKIANRISMGLILAALIIGASFLMRVETTFRLFGYPGFAILLFLLAVSGGFLLIINILFTDRMTKKKLPRHSRH